MGDVVLKRVWSTEVGEGVELLMARAVLASGRGEHKLAVDLVGLAIAALREMKAGPERGQLIEQVDGVREYVDGRIGSYDDLLAGEEMKLKAAESWLRSVMRRAVRPAGTARAREHRAAATAVGSRSASGGSSGDRPRPSDDPDPALAGLAGPGRWSR